MATSVRKHTVPAGTETPSRAAILNGFLSVNDIVPVANTTERSSAATSIGPTASRPLFVYRADAPVGQEIEVTENGTAWRTVMSYSGPTAWTVKRTSANANDSFASGSMVSLLSTTITGAPIGTYLITATLVLSSSITAGGNFRLVVAGVNTTDDARADVNTQVRPTSFTVAHVHGGGNLQMEVFYQAASGTTTVWTNGSRFTVGYIGL